MILLNIFFTVMSVALVAYSAHLEGRYCLAIASFACGFSVALCVAQALIVRSAS